MGLRKVLDLGEWWRRETRLPVPLGGNAVRRDVPEKDATAVATAIRESILYALSHREEALDHALRFARGVDRERADRFIGMYVNDYTLDLGEKGREAVRALLGRAFERGLIPSAPRLDWA